ncbi:alkaline phosphatase family protein [Bradyrhizobium sp. BR 1432]|uniref:alkaline phosphatase family protein n=1 Tax=Bradyrhizobium sp. BR 1432 TaxID=3447966 RepID=UPI003EE67416
MKRDFRTFLKLARMGLRVRRLRSTIPSTSVPGRSTMLTGVGAEIHGIYGNHIFKEGIFVAPAPSDLRVPTIAGRATAAGLDVACVGHAMIDPNDTDICVSACWMRSFIQGNRFMKSVSQAAIQSARSIRDPKGRRNARRRGRSGGLCRARR